MASVYRVDFLNQQKRDAGFIGAIVCETDYLDDAEMIAKLTTAYKTGEVACIKGQYFYIDGIDVSEFFGTILFGLRAYIDKERSNETNTN